MNKKILFNGVEYASVEEMPAEARALYERALAAFAERQGGTPPEGTTVDLRSVTETKIVFNGQEYGSAEEMPPEVRRVYERAVGSLGAGGGRRVLLTTRSSGAPPRPGPGSPVDPGPPVIRGEEPFPWKARLIIGALLVAVAVLAALLVFGGGR